MSDEEKNIRKGRWVWGGLTALVLAVEFYALAATDEQLVPLTTVVIDLTREHPETAGFGIFGTLCWLIYHWFLAPLWKRYRAAKRADDEGSDDA